MIIWQPAETAPRGTDYILLAVRNILGTAEGGDGRRLNPRQPFLYYIGFWGPQAGGWCTTETDQDDDVVWLDGEGAHAPAWWSPINPPASK